MFSDREAVPILWTCRSGRSRRRKSPAKPGGERYSNPVSRARRASRLDEQCAEISDVYLRYANFLRIAKPVVDVAMFYPQRPKKRGRTRYANLFAQACGYMRDIAISISWMTGWCWTPASPTTASLALGRDDVMRRFQATLDKIKAWVTTADAARYDFGKGDNFEAIRPVIPTNPRLFDMFSTWARTTASGTLGPFRRSIASRSPIRTCRLPPPTIWRSGDGWYGRTSRKRRTRAPLDACCRKHSAPDQAGYDYTLIVRQQCRRRPKARSGCGGDDHDVGEMGATGDRDLSLRAAARRTRYAAAFARTFSPRRSAWPETTRPLGVQIQ